MCAVGEKIPVFFLKNELIGFHGSFGVSIAAVILQFQQAPGGNRRTDDFDFFNGRILMVPGCEINDDIILQQQLIFLSKAQLRKQRLYF
ncbi:hypothetical protein GVanDAA622_26300 [Enterococcus faecium]|nr:hypothetical protein GVanDAA622_26300 [Enterococcus faecium]